MGRAVVSLARPVLRCGQTRLVRTVARDTNDLTIEILKRIREEGRLTKERVSETNQRPDQTNQPLDDLREELSRRIVEPEIRTATALTALSGDVRELTSFLRQMQDLRPRVEQCEGAIADIQRRLG